MPVPATVNDDLDFTGDEADLRAVLHRERTDQVVIGRLVRRSGIWIRPTIFRMSPRRS